MEEKAFSEWWRSERYINNTPDLDALYIFYIEKLIIDSNQLYLNLVRKRVNTIWIKFAY